MIPISTQDPANAKILAVSEDHLQGFQREQLGGHVVIRTTDTATAGSKYRLWTTVKVPQGFSTTQHCEFLCRMTCVEKFVLLPAKKLFALGVGHVRRRGLEPGSRAAVLAKRP